MFNLILKDFILVKNVNPLVFIFAMFISFIGIMTPIVGGILYISSMMMLAQIALAFVSGIEDKNNTELFLNSLPLDRKIIVTGKYFSLIGIIFASGLIIALFTNFIDLIGIKAVTRAANIFDILVAVCLIGLYYIFYYPVYFKFGGDKLRAFNSFTYLLMILLPAILVKFSKSKTGLDMINYLSSINLHHIGYILLGIVIILFFVSLKLSQVFYSNRDL